MERIKMMKHEMLPTHSHFTSDTYAYTYLGQNANEKL